MDAAHRDANRNDIDERVRARILVADDDPRLRHLVTTVLERAGYEVLQAEDGRHALALIDECVPDLVVLDLNMPRVSGHTVLASLRYQSHPIGILVLTSEHDQDCLVSVLDAGADDYLTKPFYSAELRARVRAILRRIRRADESADANPQLASGDFVLDPHTHSAVSAGRTVRLTRTEYGLLSVFVREPGRVFTPQQLLERVWGPTFEGQEHLVRTNVYRLRGKLEDDPHHPHFIGNRPGVGYYFQLDAD